MKKISFFITCFLLSSLLILAQSDSTRILLVKYDFSIQRDTTDSAAKRFTDIMALDIYSYSTNFYSYLNNFGRVDYKNKSKPDVSSTTISVSTKRAFNDKESEYIKINYEDKICRIYDRISKKPHYYEDSLTVPKWTLWPDTTTILNESCQKATTFYRGRDVIAWFSKNIPLQYGPWLYNGLPGLIMKVEDTRNQFTFVCREMIIKGGTEPGLLEYKDPQKISKELALDRKRLRVEDPIASVQKEWGVTFTSGGNNNPTKKGHYNPIELQ